MAIAAGGPEQPKRIEDYESIMTLLTEWLYIAAQMPHGTHAQQNVFRAAQRAGRFASALSLPVRGARRLAAELRDAASASAAMPSRAKRGALRRGRPRRGREQVVANLGWAEQAETIVSAHTHQPLADVQCSRGGRTRYWNTGAWIYEPDLSSRRTTLATSAFSPPRTSDGRKRCRKS